MLPDPGLLGLASGEFGRETGPSGDVMRLAMSTGEVTAAEVEVGPPVAPADVEDVQSLEDPHRAPPITGTALHPPPAEPVVKGYQTRSRAGDRVARGYVT